jgi:anti-sigma-K factor RskA
METRDYLESGILELYVYGLLSESENEDVAKMAHKHHEINDEIVSIEKAIVELSTCFSPFLSAENFEKIREKLMLKYPKLAEMKPRSKAPSYIGWAAALVFLAGGAYLYKELNDANVTVVNIENEKTKLQENILQLEVKNKQTESVLDIIRDNKNTIIPLGGQAAAPDAYATIYWNKETQSVYVDASGRPEPPEGKVYQIWSLRLNPLTPTSIGLLENFPQNEQLIFPVSNTADAEAFGITLEPAGGSQTPTMEQLYALGKV